MSLLKFRKRHILSYLIARFVEWGSSPAFIEVQTVADLVPLLLQPSEVPLCQELAVEGLGSVKSTKLRKASELCLYGSR